tara:strand:- start:1734 stop:2165 length:432 start_codon:yes stop_codon:yes gene_type:complete
MFFKSTYSDYPLLCFKKPSNKQCFYIEEARKLALKSTVLKKHGCVIVQDNKIIASGYNKHIAFNGVIRKLYDSYNGFVTIHAEVDALNQIKKNNIKLTSAHMYIVRIPNDDNYENFKMSCPCQNCQNYINKFPEINKIYFTSE